MRNDVDYNETIPYVLADGVTPRYLTVTGNSGDAPLTIDMPVSLPFGPVMFTLSTENTDNGTLQVLDAPDDDKLYFNIPAVTMKLLAPGAYIFEPVSPAGESDTRTDLGMFQRCVEQGFKE